MTFSKIIATGGYLPERVVTNSDLEKSIDTSDEWIVTRTGIKQRHIAAATETTSSLAVQAARQTLAQCHLQADDIDLIIVATCTPDQQFPSTACLVQAGLAIEHSVIAFDVSAACSGFIYALSIADSMIRTGQSKNALIIGAETLSRVLDWEERRTCVLFGDGAGAVILSASDKPGIHRSCLHAKGLYKDILFLPNPSTTMLEEEASPYLQMQGSEVFRFAVKALGDVVDEVLTDSGFSQADIDWLIPHQANLRIIQATAKKLDLPLEKVILTLEKHANTSAASVPLALDAGVRDGRIKPGDLLLMEAIGGGMAWGASLITL